MKRTLKFVTIDKLDTGDVLLGVEQHGYVLVDLRVKLSPKRDEPVYVLPGVLDPNYPVILLPDTRLTIGGLSEAARIYLRNSGEHGDSQTAEIEILVRQATDAPSMPDFRDAVNLRGLTRGVYIHPRGRLGFNVSKPVRVDAPYWVDVPVVA